MNVRSLGYDLDNQIRRLSYGSASYQFGGNEMWSLAVHMNGNHEF